MTLTLTLFFIAVIIFSAVIHEYAHGWMANQLGDPTARYAGRLTINPLAHLDWFGSVILPILLIPTGLIFAYAKPVPYNPYNLKDQKWGPVWVAIAGPISNIILAVIFGIIAQVLPLSEMTQYFAIIVFANVLLAVFNMVPIPPLDGSKILFALLPPSAIQLRKNLHQYGFVFLILFVFLGFSLIRPIIDALSGVFLTWMSIFGL